MTTVAGVELYNNTAKLFEKIVRKQGVLRKTVAGVGLNNNTALQRKANDETDDVTTCRIFEKTVRK